MRSLRRWCGLLLDVGPAGLDNPLTRPSGIGTEIGKTPGPHQDRFFGFTVKPDPPAKKRGCHALTDRERPSGTKYKPLPHGRSDHVGDHAPSAPRSAVDECHPTAEIKQAPQINWTFENCRPAPSPNPSPRPYLTSLKLCKILAYRLLSIRSIKMPEAAG